MIRAEFGPTLPQLVARRFGLPLRRATALCAAGFALVALGALALRGDDTRRELLHQGPLRTFTLVYPTRDLQRVPPGPGELERLRARRGRLTVTVFVRPLDLSGRLRELPIEAEKYAAGLAAELPAFEIREEGRTRLSGAPGYEIGFRAGRPGNRVVGREVLVVPGGRGLRGGVAIGTRITKPGRPLDAGDRDLLTRIRRAANSLQFGSERH